MSCVNYLRSTTRYSSAGLVYIPENLPSGRGGELAYVLQHIGDSITMSEYGRAGEQKRPGVNKDQKITQNMVVRARRLLGASAIHLSADLAGYGNTREERTASAAENVDKLCSQLLAFKYDTKHNKWSGKDGVSGRDDTAVAFLMALYWPETFYNSDAYADFRRSCNQRHAAAMAPPPPDERLGPVVLR